MLKRLFRQFAQTSALLAGLVTQPAGAAVITVDTLDGGGVSIDGQCNLTEATVAANFNVAVDTCASGSATGTDTIVIAVTGTIDMTQDLAISERVTIQGQGINSLTLSGGEMNRHFIVEMADDTHDFELSQMTVADGRAPLSEDGGAIRVDRVGTARVSDVRFLNNAASGSGSVIGGAIAAAVPAGDSARLELVQCSFEDGSAPDGGALAVLGAPDFADFESVMIDRCSFVDNSSLRDFGTLFIEGVDIFSVSQSVFRGNFADIWGGAISYRANSSNDLVLVDASTFDSNSAGSGGDGGAIAMFGGTAGIVNSSFVLNFAARGAAVFLSDGASATIRFATFDRNLGNTLWSKENSSLHLGHSIVRTAQGSLDPDCQTQSGGTITSLGFNIDSSGSCTSQASDLPMTDPLLFSLADQGDSAGEMVIETLLPKPDSPAIDGGMAADCPGLFGIDLVEDQRGEPRPVSGPLRNTARCDIGAVEVQASDPEGVPLTVALTGSGNATVNASPGSLRCPGRCEDRFLTGETAVIGAQPGFRAEFVGWGGDCTGMANPCELTMDGSKTVTAEFIQLYVVGVQLDGNAPGTVTSTVQGLIDCPGICAELVTEGESVTLEATSAAGNRFQNWSGPCTGTGPCTVTMTQDQWVTAVFVNEDTIFLDDFE